METTMIPTIPHKQKKETKAPDPKLRPPLIPKNHLKEMPTLDSTVGTTAGTAVPFSVTVPGTVLGALFEKGTTIVTTVGPTTLPSGGSKA